MLELPMTEQIKLEHAGSVLTLSLDDPASRNALSDVMIGEIHQVLDLIREDRSIRTLVLRGEGGFFCAGGNLKAFDAAKDVVTEEQVAHGNRVFGELLIKLNEQPQTVIALVEGAAIGGGLGLACLSDVCIVTRDAKFRLSETSLGLPPAQIAPFVTERVGLTQARRLMLTGARFTGDEACALGIAHYVVADAQAMKTQCEEVLDQIARCAPGASSVTKNIIFESLRKSRSDALDHAALGFARCMLSEEGREGITAFVEKRSPAWAEM